MEGKKEIFLDDTPLDYSTLPDLTPEECDAILEKEKQRLKELENNK